MVPSARSAQWFLNLSLSTSHGTIDTREGLLITVEYEGQRATGEGIPLHGWTDSFDACREALGRAAAKKAASNEDWNTVLAQLDAPAARHGLSLAIASARARMEEQPLYRSLQATLDVDTEGPAQKETVEHVPVNATIGALSTPAEAAAKAMAADEEGFACIKC